MTVPVLGSIRDQRKMSFFPGGGDGYRVGWEYPVFWTGRLE
jgi:hypothetical protein